MLEDRPVPNATDKPETMVPDALPEFLYHGE
jgi:hypothetical protein